MDEKHFLKIFANASGRLNKKLLKEKQLEVSTGIILDSVFLKLYKKAWTNNAADPLNAEARIFFSVWVNDKTISQKKISYNIHALKLRKLDGHDISSRLFADEFKKRFKGHEKNWENVHVKFGPLTLMEGSVDFDEQTIQNNIIVLAEKFLTIDGLIDETLNMFSNDQPKSKPAAQKNTDTTVKDGDQCNVIGGTHKGKSGIVRDLNLSKTGHITITVVQKNGDRFKTLAKNVIV